MTLVPLTGWRCLGCGLMTDRGFPPTRCCPNALPVRALVDEPDLTPDQVDEINEARRQLTHADQEQPALAPAVEQVPLGAAA